MAQASLLSINPASDPNNPNNWTGAQFGDGSGFTFSPPGTNVLPTLPASAFVPQPGTVNTVTSQGGGAAGVGAGNIGTTAATSFLAPSNPVTNAQAAPVSGSIADYFARTIIVILGFIFVAIGLNMLRPGIVPDPRNLRSPA